MEKMIILLFVLVAFVYAASGTVSPPAPTTTQAVTSDMTQSVSSTPATTSTTSPPASSTKPPATSGPTSGAVTVKAFAGLVVSVFFIALM